MIFPSGVWPPHWDRSPHSKFSSLLTECLFQVVLSPLRLEKIDYDSFKQFGNCLFSEGDEEEKEGSREHDDQSKSYPFLFGQYISEEDLNHIQITVKEIFNVLKRDKEAKKVCHFSFFRIDHHYFSL